MDLKSVSLAARNGEARQEPEKRPANTPPALITQQGFAAFEVVVIPIGGGRFSAQLGGRVVVESSRQPFLDAARVLLAEGADPKARLGMRHHGADHAALTSTVGKAARLDVKVSTFGTPIFGRHQDRAERRFAAPPDRFCADPVNPSPLGWLVLPARRATR